MSTNQKHHSEPLIHITKRDAMPMWKGLAIRAAAIVLQGTEQEKIHNVHFTRVKVDEAKIGLSMEHAEGICFTDCNLGGYAGVPTTASAKDKVFEGDKK